MIPKLSNMLLKLWLWYTDYEAPEPQERDRAMLNADKWNQGFDVRGAK